MARTIEITVQDHEVAAALNRLVNAISDMSPAMRGIAVALMESADQAFADEADPATGIKWPPLSPTTIARRAGNGPILQVTGKLRRIQSEYGKDFAAVGSPMKYAATHQFGARQGRYGRSKRGGPIPWGNIPPRPFLGLDDTARDDILDILSRHLSGR